MIVGICKIALYLPSCRSLKDKRSILRKLKDKFFSQFKILLSEVGDLDLWQRASMGFAVVGSDKKLVESIIEKALNFVDLKEGAEIIDRAVEFIHFNGRP
jgi:uncharacterized protein YlxP (DUF503 family)